MTHLSTTSPKPEEKTGFSHPLFFFASFLFCTVALNSDFGQSPLVWWGTVFAYLVVWLLTSGNKLHIDPMYTTWLLAFFAVGAFSIIWASSASIVLNALKSLAIKLFLMILIGSSIRTRKDLYRFLATIAGSAVLNSFYLLIVSFDTLTAPTKTGVANRLGDYGTWNANAVGMLAAISILIFLYFFQTKPKTSVKIVCILLIGAMVVITLLSGSRKAFVIALAGTVFYLLLSNPSKRLQTILFAFAFVWIILYLAMETEFFYAILGNRIDGFLALVTGEGEADSSAINREKLIVAAINTWKQHPILGCGLDCFQMYTRPVIGESVYAHNNYVELLADLGIFGTVIYYSYPLVLAGKLFKKLKEKKNETVLFFILLITIFAMDFASVTYTEYLFSFIYLAIFSYTSTEFNGEKKRVNAYN